MGRAAIPRRKKGRSLTYAVKSADARSHMRSKAQTPAQII